MPDGESLFEIGQGGMQFQNICFSYNNHSDTLRKIDFTVKPGEKIALVVRSAGPPSFGYPLDTLVEEHCYLDDCSLGRPHGWKANTSF